MRSLALILLLMGCSASTQGIPDNAYPAIPICAPIEVQAQPSLMVGSPDLDDET